MKGVRNMIYTSVFSIRCIIPLPSLLQNAVFRGQSIKFVEQPGGLGKEPFLFFYCFVNQTLVIKITAGFLVYFFLETCELILVNN